MSHICRPLPGVFVCLCWFLQLLGHRPAVFEVLVFAGPGGHPHRLGDHLLQRLRGSRDRPVRPVPHLG